MSRRSGLGVLLLSLLGFACGETSRNGPANETSGGAGVDISGGRGGRPGSKSTGGAGTDDGGAAPGGTGGADGGTAGSGTGGTGTGGGPELSAVFLDGTPIYTRVQRLTNAQWENAVTDILRFTQRHELSARFVPPPSGLTTFDNNEKVLFVDLPNFVDFESGAEAAAAIATSSAEALAALDTGDDAAGFVRVLGRRAFRRPLTADEETKYQTIFSFGERLYGAGFANGAALVIRAMLESPHFLYRSELGPAGDPLSPFELASKLSFWLLGTTPSDSLLDAAAAGKLASNQGLEATAREMLDDPRAVEVMRDFHGQLLHVESFLTIQKVGAPEYDAAINPEFARASNAFFDLVFQKNLGVRELLTWKQAYVGPGLAPFYGLDPPAGLELRDLDSSRSGYFMQVPFLMLRGQNTESAPVERGYQLVQTMLCGALGVPGAHVPPLPPLMPGQTNRQRMSELTQNCGGACHTAYIDPLGFAFENFDGLGRNRETDNGQPVDTSASYPFAEGSQAFADGNELMKIMAGSAQVHTCYSKNVTGYALGRDLVESDRPLLESLGKVSLSESLKEMVVALVRDPAFRTRKEGQP
ncbi:MAG TPA: DUF1592 domain-containing protein [Polyangiaceae bacterium]|nr:DUF1592 domain-containing protein [Polyangiaceae bacterium]